VPAISDARDKRDKSIFRRFVSLCACFICASREECTGEAVRASAAADTNGTGLERETRAEDIHPRLSRF
jgi:hypothetical protein